jgi:thiosulfate/3-mercaptopyruvate sulfurtransferase
MAIAKRISIVLMGLLLGTSLFSSTTMAGNNPLLSPEWLLQNLKNSNMVILDVGAFTHYERRHIPGAVKAFGPWMTMNEDFTGFMMPKTPDLIAMLKSYGVNNNSFVVIYDEGLSVDDTAKSARALWTLEALGHKNTAILDGGFASWEQKGYAVSKTAATPEKGGFSGKLNLGKLAFATDVQSKRHNNSVLIDNRLPYQYFGKEKNSEIDRFGHIPGSLLWPAYYMSMAGVDLSPSFLRDIKELRLMAAGVGIPADKNTEIITYSNHGKRAALGYFVLHDILGYKNVRLYDGSMLEYAALNTPLETYRWGR